MKLNKASKNLVLSTVMLLAGLSGRSDTMAVPANIEESHRNQAAVLKFLGPALKDRGGIGRIYCITACATKSGTPLPFPLVMIQPASEGASGLAAVRDIFRNDQKTSVAESPSGMIRVTIEQPKSSILQTKIPLLTFSQAAQYDEVRAVDAILGCKEVQAAKRQLGFEEPLTVESLGVAPFDKRAPHLPARMRNLTVDQALDEVAKIFGGIVIYKECANENGKRLFTIDFTKATESPGY